MFIFSSPDYSKVVLEKVCTNHADYYDIHTFDIESGKQLFHESLYLKSFTDKDSNIAISSDGSKLARLRFYPGPINFYNYLLIIKNIKGEKEDFIKEFNSSYPVYNIAFNKEGNKIIIHTKNDSDNENYIFTLERKSLKDYFNQHCICKNLSE